MRRESGTKIDRSSGITSSKTRRLLAKSFHKCWPRWNSPKPLLEFTLNRRTSNSASSSYQAISNRRPGLRLQNTHRLTISLLQLPRSARPCDSATTSAHLLTYLHLQHQLGSIKGRKERSAELSPREHRQRCSPDYRNHSPGAKMEQKFDTIVASRPRFGCYSPARNRFSWAGPRWQGGEVERWQGGKVARW